LIIGILSLTFGVTALIWTIKARKSLSKGSSLKAFTTNFMIIVIFVLCFSSWDIAVRMLYLKDLYGELVQLPMYLFITLAYIAFVGAAYKIRNIGKEFGFTTQSKAIEKVIEKTKKRKKKK